MSDTDQFTEKLQAWRSGDAAALEHSTPYLYDELRRLARGCLSRERGEHQLTPATLAHWMRQILVEFARHRRADTLGVLPEADLVDLDQALERLEATDARKARVVELRYFAGFTVDEAAQVLGVSSAAIQRELRMAEAWLCRELGAHRPDGLKRAAAVGGASTLSA